MFFCALSVRPSIRVSTFFLFRLGALLIDRLIIKYLNSDYNMISAIANGVKTPFADLITDFDIGNYGL